MKTSLEKQAIFNEFLSFLEKNYGCSPSFKCHYYYNDDFENGKESFLDLFTSLNFDDENYNNSFHFLEMFPLGFKMRFLNFSFYSEIAIINCSFSENSFLKTFDFTFRDFKGFQFSDVGVTNYPNLASLRNIYQFLYKK